MRTEGVGEIVGVDETGSFWDTAASLVLLVILQTRQIVPPS